jgi:hypothetical protein
VYNQLKCLASSVPFGHLKGQFSQLYTFTFDCIVQYRITCEIVVDSTFSSECGSFTIAYRSFLDQWEIRIPTLPRVSFSKNLAKEKEEDSPTVCSIKNDRLYILQYLHGNLFFGVYFLIVTRKGAKISRASNANDFERYLF